MTRLMRTELFVQEAYRYLGIGCILVDRLAYEDGTTELLVLTSFTNYEAQSLYLYYAMGYEDDDRAMSKALLSK